MFNTKHFKGKYEAKLEFPEGCWGSNQKTSMRGVWILSRTTHSTKCIETSEANLYDTQGLGQFREYCYLYMGC